MTPSPNWSFIDIAVAAIGVVWIVAALAWPRSDSGRDHLRRSANVLLYLARDGTVVLRSDKDQAIAMLSNAGFQTFMRNYVAGQDVGVIELAHALAKARPGEPTRKETR